MVREVLKLNSVEHVTLCDIDEAGTSLNQKKFISHATIHGHSYVQAVIRASKQYLPHMSALLSDPRVTVHIGDGLEFLTQNTTTYDAIITDCSDPEGPAASLFQQPYFQLLRDRLNPGGHISIQAESIWLHLPTIRELLDTARPFFPTVEYAYATVPTYPSGQIGFLVASREPEDDLRTPQRSVLDIRYYNAHVHRAAFVLPEFCRVFLEENSDIRPNLRMGVDRSTPEGTRLPMMPID